MKKIPVIAFKNKNKTNRYLAASMDFGDWEDDELDVKQENIQCAMMLWREDHSKPDETDVQKLVEMSNKHKERMIEEFGDAAFVSFDVEGWLKEYDPVNLEITEAQWIFAKSIE